MHTPNRPNKPQTYSSSSERIRCRALERRAPHWWSWRCAAYRCRRRRLTGRANQRMAWREPAAILADPRRLRLRLMQVSGVPVPPVAGDGAGGGVSPDGRINGWPGGSQPPSWQTQSGPGTGGMQLLPLAAADWRLPACRQRVLRRHHGEQNDRTHKPTRRMIHL